jgi:cellobiose transport system permease protein
MSMSATKIAPSRGAPKRTDRHEPPPGISVRLARLDIKASPYLYIAPFFVLFAIFGLYPMAQTAWMSLHDWDLIGDHTFIGLDNYAAVFGDEYFWNAVVNTVGMFLLATVPQLLLALLLANLLNRPRLRARTLFRLTVFIPNVTSVAAVAIVFGMLFQRDFGVVNWALEFVGVREHIDWDAQRWSSWAAISVMVDWRWVGYNALIFLAGMQAIPRDLYEAAAIDGASPWRQFWSITLPMLRPTLLFVVTVSTIWGLQLFTEPLIFNNGNILGGVQREFQTVTMYVYEKAIENTNTAGYGAAVAWMLFVMIILVSLVNFLVVRRSVR